MTKDRFDKALEVTTKIKSIEHRIECFNKVVRSWGKFTTASAGFWRNDERLVSLYSYNGDKRLIRRMCFLAIKYYKKELKKLKKQLEEL